MSSCWATRRASSTSATEQQPVSLSPPHRRIVTPTTWWPARTSSAAATDESTPPLSATSTFIGRARTAARAAGRDGGDDGVGAAVDVGRRGGAAEREAQRAAGQRPGHAHRGEHVRRLHRPAGARRRRGGAHLGLVEQVQQRLVLHALDAHVRRAGHLAVARHGLDHARQLGPTIRSTSGRAARRPARSRVALGGGEAQRLGQGDDAGDVVRAAAPLALLPAADEQRGERRAVAHGEHADALRPAELVGRQRQRVDVRPQLGEVEPARRLHRVGVQHRAGRAGGARARRPRPDR